MMGFLAMMYTGGQKYAAAASFKNALESDAQGQSLEDLGGQVLKAVQTDSQRDEYHRNLSAVFHAMANKRAAEKNEELSAEDLNFISGMIKSSLQEAEAAKNLNPENPQNYLSLARVYEGVLATTEEADKKAVENYQKAIELDPRNPSLYHKIANVYVTMFDLARAKNQSQSQGQPGGSQPEITKEEQKYLLLAKDNLNKALEINPRFVQSKMFLTEVHQREGDMTKAISNEEEIKKMAPNSPQISFRLGLLYHQNEQTDQARKELERTVSLDKNHLTARYFLGLLYEEDGNTDKALEQFEKIAELDEENEEIKRIIENVKAGRDPLEGVLEEGQEGESTEEIFQETREEVEEQVQPEGEEEDQTEIDPEVEDQQLPVTEEETTF
jgi:tetratricopeptide (TPR) repeat protein